MKYLTILSLFLCVVNPSFAQSHATEANAKSASSKERADRMPSAGYDFREYLHKELHYPLEARKDRVEGKVMIGFLVGDDGVISDAKVISGIGGGCDEEALRVVKNMPPWKPAIKNGQPVKAYMTLPVLFSLKSK